MSCLYKDSYLNIVIFHIGRLLIFAEAGHHGRDLGGTWVV